MEMSQRQPAYLRLIDFLIERVTPEEILAFSATEEERKRAERLHDRQSDRVITPEEKVELDEIRYGEEWLSILKARALAFELARHDVEAGAAPQETDDDAQRIRALTHLLVALTFELRTPLNSIRGYAAILKATTKLEKNEQELVEYLIHASQYALDAVMRAGILMRGYGQNEDPLPDQRP